MLLYMVNLLLLNAVFLMTNKTDFHLRYYPFRWCTVVCLALTPPPPPPPPPHATYRSQWTGSSLVQVMDCHLVETKPLPGGRFKNTYELLNLRALKISKLHKNHIFQCMGKIFCVEFQRVPLKFHTKYLTHTLKDVDFIHIWKFKSS